MPAMNAHLNKHSENYSTRKMKLDYVGRKEIIAVIPGQIR